MNDLIYALRRIAEHCALQKVCDGISFDGWDKSKHPRGNPNNAGQFAKKGESTKITNCDGSPKTLYHGTGQKFDRFDSGRIGERSSWNGSGFYFTDSETDAKLYGPEVMKVNLDIKNPFDANDYDSLELPMDKFGLKGRTLPDVEQEIANIAKGIKLAKDKEKNGRISVFCSSDEGKHYKFLTYTWQETTDDEYLKNRAARDVFSEKYGVEYYSKPLLRDFSPTIVSEIVKKHGYDGIVAESSNLPGAKEYVVFNPDQIHVLKGTENN